MYVPGIDTTFPQYYSLFKSVNTLITLIEHDNENHFPELIAPTVLTLYSAFECFLSNLEEPIINNPEMNPLYENRPKMEKRPFVLYEIKEGVKFDKSLKIYDDYNHFIKLRNLIAHSKYESIKWSNLNIQTSEFTKMSPLGISKKEMRKVDRTAIVSRDEKADKVISFLERRKIINIESQYRMAGWLHCIQIPQVAIWANNTITEMMKILGEDRNNQM